ncbi:2-methoxy-6-polyprenyl-1,4-benzoquinol methylase, mitochondrial-like isoform X2 [Phragmites australis]|uniref:2-methoxy-6-polyprenyl-1,4-benzoquinol methylase, mitochondrial-like isoform X2 n=1 Tax=Phragmites australis TaxID=29695 RepID=UPI002D7835F0|nr:2-methoxy-6-polyprenyl-1,4-benzoquinol methylase, mitochondrial-like isoform X2 [Phragmites australis]
MMRLVEVGIQRSAGHTLAHLDPAAGADADSDASPAVAVAVAVVDALLISSAAILVVAVAHRRIRRGEHGKGRRPPHFSTFLLPGVLSPHSSMSLGRSGGGGSRRRRAGEERRWDAGERRRRRLGRGGDQGMGRRAGEVGGSGAEGRGDGRPSGRGFLSSRDRDRDRDSSLRREASTDPLRRLAALFPLAIFGGRRASTRGRIQGIGMALRAARKLASCSRQRRLLLLLPSPAPNMPAAFLHSHATSFGYKQVREEEKSRLVGNVFSSVASSYDLMSIGLHRLWKDRLISKLNPFPGMKHLDVAGGTGDVAFRVLERIKSVSHRAMQGTLTDVEEDTHIYVCDINPNMLNVGKKRAAERGYREEHCLSWIQGDAEALSFEDGSMDGYTIAFGIRNVTHIEKALSEAYRVLKRGGRFLCLELSHVDVPLFKEMKSSHK